MNGIKEYLLTLTTSCIIGVIADIITSSISEKHPDIEKAVRLGISVCVLSAVLLPIFANSFSDDAIDGQILLNFETENVEFDEAEFLEKEAEGETEKYIYEKTGIKPLRVRINIEVKDGDVAVSEAEVTIDKADSAYEQAIITAAYEALGREVDILYAE